MYFMDRTQCVDVDGCVSEVSLSLLSPLMYCKGLFLALVYILYVNDLSSCLEFVDDTILFAMSKTTHYVPLLLINPRFQSSLIW